MATMRGVNHSSSRLALQEVAHRISSLHEDRIGASYHFTPKTSESKDTAISAIFCVIRCDVQQYCASTTCRAFIAYGGFHPVQKRQTASMSVILPTKCM